MMPEEGGSLLCASWWLGSCWRVTRQLSGARLVAQPQLVKWLLSISEVVPGRGSLLALEWRCHELGSWVCYSHFSILSKMEVKSDTWCECLSGLSIHSPQNQKVLGQWIQPIRLSSKHCSSDLSQVSTSSEGRLSWLCFCLMLSLMPLNICAQLSEMHSDTGRVYIQLGTLGKKPAKRLHNTTVLRK